MKITILSSKSSWINEYLQAFVKELGSLGNEVKIINKSEDMEPGDIAFFLSCFEIVPDEKLKLHKNNLIVHESDLPHGKGWSPLTWQILEGKNEVPITLIEASHKVDSGEIYLKDTMRFNGTELVDELRKIQADYTFKLCLEFVKNYPEILNNAQKQAGEESFYPKRTPEHSKIGIDKTIREQFNLLRVVDNENYPAFFELNGEKYILRIEKE